MNHLGDRPVQAAGAPAAGDPAAAPSELARVLALEDAVRARDDFLAIAAHELRSPLHSLALRMAVLERLASSQADTALRDEIRRARASVERYVRRAAVLLDVARLNAGELRPVRGAVDIRRLVAEVADTHRDEAEFHHVDLRTEVRGDGVGRWDPHMAEQILSNLVANAIKYGPGAPVEVVAQVDAGHARFEVRDQGPGIGDDDRARIFAKFERIVDGSRNTSGYGLGLWIVGSMVAAHGGTIEVESGDGRGTLFRVTLPLA
jgi:signal transduction histidine kinase